MCVFTGQIRLLGVSYLFYFYFFCFFQPVLIYARANHKLLAESNNGIEFFSFYNSLMRLYITHSYWIWLSFIRMSPFEWFRTTFSSPPVFSSLALFLLFCISRVSQTAYLHPYCHTADDIPGYWVHYSGGRQRQVAFKWQGSADNEKQMIIIKIKINWKNTLYCSVKLHEYLKTHAK